MLQKMKENEAEANGRKKFGQHKTKKRKRLCALLCVLCALLCALLAQLAFNKHDMQVTSLDTALQNCRAIEDAAFLCSCGWMK
jgi:cell division septal protein FtsQ